MVDPQFAGERQQMIATIRRLSGGLARMSGTPVVSERVIDVMAEVPRHEFVRPSERAFAYANEPLAIGHGQTISQPFIVALMTGLARIEPHHRVLEIGTGSGYQTAILAKLADQVFSVETVEALTEVAAERLRRLGIVNVALRTGDGHQGLAPEAPFDAIVVTAAPDHVPEALVAQLAVPGRLVLPVGASEQMLRVIERHANGQLTTADIVAVRFVPLVRD